MHHGALERQSQVTWNRIRSNDTKRGLGRRLGPCVLVPWTARGVMKLKNNKIQSELQGKSNVDANKWMQYIESINDLAFY